MRAILKKTISRNFRAGDILQGENARIKNLVSKNIAVLDSSLLSYIAIWISVFTNFAIMGFLVFMWIPISGQLVNFEIPLIWRVVMFVIAIKSVLINFAYLNNVKAPYIVTFLMSVFNPIAATMFLIGHERVAAAYQPKTMMISANMFVGIMSILIFGTLLLSLLDYNIILFPNVPGFSLAIMFPLWVTFIVIGIIGSIAFDMDFISRRKRFITFITKQNVKIEYRTKAVNAYRTYLNTGNAEKLLKENVDIMSETLHENRIELEKIK